MNMPLIEVEEKVAHNGKVQFRSQRDINQERREKRQRKREELERELKKILATE
ncbi:hypothetical protein MUO14_08320 [Halobacillus shinanisalinarum]|uniref:Uncharacterized protein n=1 Tax=Halobacillus shinanisalinarum TaxID=2932258 RepID=A0ABY4H386_9BACI|nr:hypothetical protein [Halobacillus shinanisalinarum]UOQ94916.1 hypothetical protein MUO14_08320 [Halobacillus shinanisalinarum]